MPTYSTTVDIGTTTTGATVFVNDGQGGTSFAANKFTNGVNYAKVWDVPPNFAKTGAWFRFNNITIPKSAIINTATLKLYACISFGGTKVLTVQLDSRQTPGNPTGNPQVTAPANVEGSITTNITGSNTDYKVKGNYSLRNIDVKTLVQALVNNYDYSNGEMVFYLNATGASSQIVVYFRDWGSDKQASLEVNYTVLQISDKTTVVFI